MFDLNRMLAIFHVIVDQKVTSTAEIQSQIASLVTLQMLTQNGEDLDLPKYKCNVSLDFIRQVSKNVRFELHKYLYDVEN
jgi:origin recognition complex subunit 5